MHNFQLYCLVYHIGVLSSKHMTSKQRRIDVVSTSCACLDKFFRLRFVLIAEKKVS